MDNKWNFEIMTDSAANLSEDVIRRYGLTILSQTYTIDGVEYRGYEKGKDISADPVYEMMREKKEIRTSLVNAQEAEQETEQLLRAGRDILYIGLSSALSGTFQVVRFTFEELQEKYPDRQLAAVDSLSLSLESSQDEGRGIFSSSDGTMAGVKPSLSAAGVYCGGSLLFEEGRTDRNGGGSTGSRTKGKAHAACG